MFSPNPQIPKIDTTALPASDFKDLITQLTHLQHSTSQCKRKWETLQAHAIRASPSTTLHEMAEKLRLEIGVLQQQYRELDTHYGWVLACDHVFIAEGLSLPAEERGERAKLWVRGLCTSHAVVGLEVAEMSRALEESGECA